MSFGKTKDALTNICDQPSVSMENALGFFLDFCDDCGGRIDKLSIEDSEAFVKNLRKCNRVILDIINKCDMGQISSDAVDRIHKQKESMDKLEQELSMEERRILEESKDIEGRKAALNAKKERVERLRKEKYSEVSQLESDIELIQHQCDDYDLKSAQLQSEMQDIAERAENAEKDYKIKLFKKKELEDSKHELIESMEKLSQEVAALEKELNEKVIPSSDQVKVKRLALQNKIDLLNSDLDDSDTVNKRLEDEINAKTALLHQAQLTQSDLLKELSENKEQLKEITEEVQRLREACADDNEERLIRELETQKYDLERKKAAIENLKEQKESIDQQIEGLTQDLDSIKIQVQEKEAEQAEIGKNMAQYTDKLAMLKSRTYDISAMQEKTARLKNIADSLEKDSRIMAGQFGGSGFSLNEALSGTLTNADILLKKVRSEIDDYIKNVNSL